MLVETIIDINVAIIKAAHSFARVHVTHICSIPTPTVLWAHARLNGLLIQRLTPFFSHFLYLSVCMLK